MPNHARHSRPSRGDRHISQSFEPNGSAARRRTYAPKHGRPIHEVAPAPLSNSREGAGDYAKRMSRRSYAQTGMRKHRRKSSAIAAAIVAIAILAALIAGVTVYFKDTNSNLSLADSKASDMLVEPAEESVFLTLCSADIGRSGYEVPAENKLALMLVRADLGAKTLSFVTIPSSLAVKLSDLTEEDLPAGDDAAHSLSEIESEYGEAALIKAVSTITGTDINHFIATDSKGINELVTAVDGLSMMIESEIDDPNAGVIVLEAGEEELDGEKALTLIRATNVKGGFEAASSTRIAFTLALLSKALDPEGLGFANILSNASKAIATDMDARFLLETGDKLRPLDSYDISIGMIPCSSSTSIADGKKAYSYDPLAVKAYMDHVMEGDDAAGGDDASDNVPTSDISVEIRNGAAIDGAGASLGDRLASLGYEIGEVGNTNDSTIYPETLIIYTDQDHAGAAKAVQRDIGAGRIVNGGDFYSTDSDVLVIIGADWR